MMSWDIPVFENPAAVYIIVNEEKEETSGLYHVELTSENM
jgi:hypothetical protein